MKTAQNLQQVYFAEFQVIDGLNQHPDGYNFLQWINRYHPEFDKEFSIRELLSYSEILKQVKEINSYANASLEQDIDYVVLIRLITSVYGINTSRLAPSKLLTCKFYSKYVELAIKLTDFELTSNLKKKGYALVYKDMIYGHKLPTDQIKYALLTKVFALANIPFQIELSGNWFCYVTFDGLISHRATNQIRDLLGCTNWQDWECFGGWDEQRPRFFCAYDFSKLDIEI